MWIKTQDGFEILEVKRFKLLASSNSEARILAKLDRETLVLGTYEQDQAESIMADIWHLVGLDAPYRTDYYTMPPRWEDLNKEVENG